MPFVFTGVSNNLEQLNDFLKIFADNCTNWNVAAIEAKFYNICVINHTEEQNAPKQQSEKYRLVSLCLLSSSEPRSFLTDFNPFWSARIENSQKFIYSLRLFSFLVCLHVCNNSTATTYYLTYILHGVESLRS